MTRLTLSRPKTAEEAFKFLQRAESLKLFGPLWSVQGRTRQNIRYEAINIDLVRPGTELVMMTIGVILMSSGKSPTKMILQFQKKSGRKDLWSDRFELGPSSVLWEKAVKKIESWLQKSAVLDNFIAEAYRRSLEEIVQKRQLR